MGIKHRIIVSEEIDIPGYADNPPDRCYYCKNELFGKIKYIAAKEDYQVVFDASRFPYGEKISKAKLDRLAMSEFEVRNLGFTQFRIRSHENLVTPCQMKNPDGYFSST